MRRHARSLCRALLLCCWTGLAVAQHGAPEKPELLREFEDPPQAARPQVWWHWMSGNVTEEGARLDLAWFHRIGIGGVGAFSGGGSLEKTFVEHPLPFLSPGWNAVYRDSVAAARHYGMDVMIAGSPGWSETGAPWVRPHDGMKKYTWSETVVRGGSAQGVRLAPPPSATGAFQGMDQGRSLPAYGGVPSSSGAGPVIALPIAEDDTVEIDQVRGAEGPLPQLLTLPGDLSGSVAVAMKGSGSFLQLTLKRPSRVAGLTLAASPLPDFTVRCLDCEDGERVVGRYRAGDVETPCVEQTITFPAVKGTRFRIDFDPSEPGARLPGLPATERTGAPADQLQVHAVRLLGEGHVDRFEAKAEFQTSGIPVTFDGIGTNGRAVPRASVLDVSDRLHGDTLDWTPPPGHWLILRFGWSLTGTINEPAEASATGLEVDKLSRPAVVRYTDALFRAYTDRVHSPLGGKDGINELLTDSWEVGPQNWSLSFLEDFRRLRGYDATPWLPVLAGRVVESKRQSDDFLEDFRQTLRDLLVANHFDTLHEIANRHGLQYYTEHHGDTPRALGDGMTVKAHSDVPTGELWLRPYNASRDQPALLTDLREAASAAHVYGKPLVAAESFTVAAGEDPWSFAPATLKRMADEEFGLGVNRILLHESHMQPFADRKPGLELGFYGIFFNRNDTWADEARPFIDYLSRTSLLLQQGHAVADVAYLYGEDRSLTELFHHHENEDVPRGFNYDYLNEEGLLQHVRVQGHDVETDSGTRYRVLYLSKYASRLHVTTLRRLRDLVRQGAVLVGVRPLAGLGLETKQGAFQEVCDQIWGAPQDEAQPRRVGQGKVYATTDLLTVLNDMGAKPDVTLPLTYDVWMQHRQTPGRDIYFMVNRSDTALDGWVQFRVTGTVPQLWSALDGTVRPVSFRDSGESTAVRLPMGPRESVLLVFEGRDAIGERSLAEARVTREMTVSAPWQVTFQAGRGAPASAVFPELQDWSRSVDPGIRFFSGTATYHASFDLEAVRGSRYVLDLGDVREVAVVRVNGGAPQTLWCAPFRLDVTAGLRPGRNTLEVAVTNLWVNRLIGDRQPGVTPITSAPQSPYIAASPLRPSGLLGPVRIGEERDDVP